MSKLPRQTHTNLWDTTSLRLRAAWLYYTRGWTQQDIARDLGVSRSTVIRMLEEARKRSEVQTWINQVPGDCTDLALRLEETLGLAEAVVVPGAGTPAQTAIEVGAALGRFLSERIVDDMTIGVTWGRTLLASLSTFRPQPRTNTQVVSLIGGILEARHMNPIDFSWQFASRLDAGCLLYLAPLFVDSAETKKALIERCGLQKIHDVAASLDLAVISCGDIAPGTGSLIWDHLTGPERQEVLAGGAICDVGCNFLDREGNDVPTTVRDRSMSVDLSLIAAAGHIVLAAGGAERATAIRATITRTRCQTLITNEAAANAILQQE